MCILSIFNKINDVNMKDDVRLLSPDALNPLQKPAVSSIVGMLLKIPQCAT